MSERVRAIRHLCLLVVAFFYIGTQVDAETGLKSKLTDYCGDSVCQSEGCSFGGNETPGDGCLEDGGNCAEDCGYCGDLFCSPEIGEDLQDCVYDCGYCGDDVCTHPWETTFGTWCTDDCGEDPNACQDECTESSDCGSGQYCNPDHCCINESINVGTPTACGGNCAERGECCGLDVCVTDSPFSGHCVFPGEGLCYGAVNCSTHNDCNPEYAAGVPNKYCEPSIGKCVWTRTPGCVYPTDFCPLGL